MSKTTETGHSTESNNGRLTVSEQHDVLASERRRTILDVLAETQLPLDTATLAREIVDREYGSGDSDGALARVRMSLHHTHLPKLHRVGIVEYDPESNHIETYRPFQ